MATISFEIPNDQIDRVKEGLLEVYPNASPSLTDNEWLKERIRRFIVDSVKQGEAIIAQRLALEALAETDSLVS